MGGVTSRFEREYNIWKKQQVQSKKYLKFWKQFMEGMDLLIDN